MKKKTIVFIGIALILLVLGYAIYLKQQKQTLDKKRISDATKGYSRESDNLQENLYDPYIREIPVVCNDSLNFDKIDSDFRDIAKFSYLVEMFLKPESFDDDKSDSQYECSIQLYKYDRDLFDHLLENFSCDFYFSEYFSIESKVMLDLFRLKFAVEENKQKEYEKYLNELLSYDYLLSEGLFRTSEILNITFSKTQARICQLEMLVKQKKYKQCHEILASHYEEFGEMLGESSNLLNEYVNILRRNDLKGDELFKERLSFIELFDNQRKNKYLSEYRVALINSEHFQDNMDLKIKWLKKISDTMNPDLFYEWQEDLESGPLSLIQMLFIKELIKNPMTKAQKKEIDILYSKAYNTCQLLAKHNERYATALKNFNLPLSKTASKDYISPNQTMNYANIAEQQKGLLTAIKNNDREKISYYSEILRKQDKNLYFNDYNVYYNTLWQLANYELKEKHYNEALDLFKEVKENSSFKAIMKDKIDYNEHLFNSFHIFLNISAFYNRFHIYLYDLKNYELAGKEIFDFLKRFNRFSINAYNRDFHLRTVFSQYLESVKNVYSPDKYQRSVENLIKKTDNKILQAFLLSKLAHYYQETDQLNKEIETLNVIIKEYRYVYHDNTGNEEGKGNYTYFCLNAIKRLKEIYKNDSVKYKQYSEMAVKYQKSFEIIFNYFYPYD